METLHYAYIDYTQAFCGAGANRGTSYQATITYDDVTCTACRERVGR